MRFLPVSLFVGLSCAVSSAQESRLVLPPLMVTGMRGSVLGDFVSASVALIDETQIRQSGARSLAELLETKAAVRITSSVGDRARGAISLRGFGENASSRSAIMIDGRPLNRPDMQGVNLQEIPLARVARIEVLRGSQTARFGDNAVGGVVNIVTKGGHELAYNQVESSVGSNDWWMGRFNHASSSGGTQVNADLEVNSDGGWRDNAQSASRTLGFGVARQVHERLRVESTFSYGEQEGRFPGPLTTLQYRQNPRMSIYSGAFAEQYASEQVTCSADMVAQLDGTALGQLEIPITWNRRDLSWNMGPGAHADNVLDSLAIAPRVRQVGARWSAEQGIELRADLMDVGLFRDFARQRPRSNAELRRATISAFSSLDAQLGEHLHLQLAARAASTNVEARVKDVRRPNDPLLNVDESLQEENAAIQWGMRYQPELTKAAWWRYDLLYRLPSMDEIASYQGFPLSQPFNEQLEAETGHNIECGLEWNPAPWKLKANAFSQFLSGEILYDFTQNLNANFADTRRLGGEVEASYEWKYGSASLIYSAVDAQFAEGAFAGNQIPLVPSQMLTSAVELRPLQTCVLRLEHQWQNDAPEGNDFANTQGELPGFQLMNFSFRHQPTPSFAWYLRINNVWDQHYASLKYNGVWFPAAGRQFQLGMQYEF